MAIHTFNMTLLSSAEIAPGVRHFVLKPEQSAAFSYIPGQFITLHFEANEKAYKRSYSIANPISVSGEIEFAASYVEKGVGSEYLFALNPGDTLKVAGPYGRLLLKPTPKRYVLVGTGTGITPYRAMLPSLATEMMQHPQREVIILQGVRTREALLYADEFRQFDAEHPKATFLAALSRQSQESLESDERGGHVQDQFDALGLDKDNDLVYLCGNPMMIDEAYAKLTEQGFSVHQVVREKYISR